MYLKNFANASSTRSVDLGYVHAQKDLTHFCYGPFLQHTQLFAMVLTDNDCKLPLLYLTLCSLSVTNTVAALSCLTISKGKNYQFEL